MKLYSEKEIKPMVKRILEDEQELDTLMGMLFPPIKELNVGTDENPKIYKYANFRTIKWGNNSLSPFKVKIKEYTNPNISNQILLAPTITVGRNAIYKIVDSVTDEEIKKYTCFISKRFMSLEYNTRKMSMEEINKQVDILSKYVVAVSFIIKRLYLTFMRQKNEIYKSLNIGVLDKNRKFLYDEISYIAFDISIVFSPLFHIAREIQD